LSSISTQYPNFWVFPLHIEKLIMEAKSSVAKPKTEDLPSWCSVTCIQN